MRSFSVSLMLEFNRVRYYFYSRKSNTLILGFMSSSNIEIFPAAGSISFTFLKCISFSAADISLGEESRPAHEVNNKTAITSTRDFSENYSGETYASIRRTAPRSYYSQDRMVNAQDYNVYPLSLGTNVVRNVKSVNTSFAVNSRFYEMDDVLGHQSNLSVTRSDGTLFVEDETI